MPAAPSSRPTATPAESLDALRRRESVRTGLLRICRRHISTALQHLEQPQKADRTEDIHQVRVHGKRLRAYLRLIRPVTDTETITRETARLREVGRSLSGFRDAFVAGETFKRVFADAAPRQMRDAARLLGVKTRPAKGRADLDSALLEAAKSLRRSLSHFRQLPFSARGWAALAPGLEKSYRRARKDYKCCVKRGAGHLGECFHDWRKHVKDLSYQLELLANLTTPEIKRLRKDCHRLGSLLGDDHDLLVFAIQVREREQHYSELANFRPVRKRVKRRLKEVRGKEFALARTLFADKPNVWITRLYDHWRGWKTPEPGLVLTIERAAANPANPPRSVGTSPLP